MKLAATRLALALGGFWFFAPAAHSADAKAPQVTVTGSGNLGIGSMTGGQVNIGLTPAEVQALQSATAKESVALLAPILKRINGQIARLTGSTAEDKIALGVAEAFLATIKGKKIPTSEWSVEFGAAARNYLRLGASIEATPVTSEKIKELVSRADAARKLGQFDEVDTVLAEATELATHDAQRIRQHALTATRQAASLYASRANLAFTRLDRRQGATLLEKAVDLRRGDVSRESVWWLFNAGDAWTTEGQTASALRAYLTARSFADAALADDPRNTQWQRELVVSHLKVGNLQAAQGDSASALKSFQAALAGADSLVAVDPRNADWQQNLSASLDGLGDIQATQGDPTSALKSYQAGTAIRERLVASDPRNTQWQRDLSVSYDRIGDVHLGRGDLASALDSFSASLAIRKRYASGDLSNNQWQRDLGVSHDRIGNAYFVQGDLDSALKSFQYALALAERLSASDPRNTEWRRDLAVTHNRIGAVRSAQGDSESALKSFRNGLSITEGLTADDPRNTQWQHDLAASHDKIGDLQVAQGNPASALKSFQSALAISEQLAAGDPRNTMWQRDVAAVCWKLASLGEVAGSVDVRQALLQKGLSMLIAQRDLGQLPASIEGWVGFFEEALRKLK